ncbi:MAG TPA: hypothetical protein VMT63_11775 [Bacteroidales bacterium]|nr:hypothetical protein [Bacteroidales bacterium]
MTSGSKIILFFIAASLGFSSSSCKKSKYDVIPTVFVNFTLNLNDPQFMVLLSPFTYLYVDKNTNNYGQNSAGYDDNGIIVFRYTEDEFFAYDRTCPYDYKENNKSIRLNVVDDIYAVCPQCSSKYALSAGGTPVKGVSRYPLKNYRTYFDGLYLTVSNY